MFDLIVLFLVLGIAAFAITILAAIARATRYVATSVSPPIWAALAVTILAVWAFDDGVTDPGAEADAEAVCLSVCSWMPGPELEQACGEGCRGEDGPTSAIASAPPPPIIEPERELPPPQPTASRPTKVAPQKPAAATRPKIPDWSPKPMSPEKRAEYEAVMASSGRLLEQIDRKDECLRACPRGAHGVGEEEKCSRACWAAHNAELAATP